VGARRRRQDALTPETGAAALLASSPVPNPRSTGSLLVGLVLALSACGGGQSGDGASAGEGTSTTAVREARTTTTTIDPGGPGGICTRLDEAAEQLDQVPLFLQLTTPDNVNAIKAKLIGDLDLDVFFRAMVVLHQLDGSTSPMGDPRDAIDAYERAAVEAKPLFASENPSQASINAYQDEIGDPGTFLAHQTPIAAALTEAGC